MRGAPLGLVKVDVAFIKARALYRIKEFKDARARMQEAAIQRVIVEAALPGWFTKGTVLSREDAIAILDARDKKSTFTYWRGHKLRQEVTLATIVDMCDEAIENSETEFFLSDTAINALPPLRT